MCFKLEVMSLTWKLSRVSKLPSSIIMSPGCCPQCISQYTVLGISQITRCWIDTSRSGWDIHYSLHSNWTTGLPLLKLSSCKRVRLKVCHLSYEQSKHFSTHLHAQKKGYWDYTMISMICCIKVVTLVVIGVKTQIHRLLTSLHTQGILY